MSHKLLLADDSVTIQRIIELTFANEDINVVVVSDGAQAIEQIKSEPPDIVLADTGMPERDGYEVAEFVKGDTVRRHIPVLLLTGAFEPLDEARAHSIGCNGCLVKPFEPKQVVSKVRELLHGDPQPEKWDLQSFVAPLVEPASEVGPPVVEPMSVNEPPSPLAEPAPISPSTAPASVISLPGALPKPAPACEQTALTKAFATFLAAESGVKLSELPTAIPEVGQALPPLGDSQMDELVSRVVEQLTDRVLRDITPEIVSRVAEQLIREELDRIKANVG